MSLRTLQPTVLEALDATIARAHEIVDPILLEGIQARIEWLVADGPEPGTAVDARESDVFAVVEQMLVDVASLDDETVRRAAAHFPDGALADLVMASYAIEARTRLNATSARLLDHP